MTASARPVGGRYLFRQRSSRSGYKTSIRVNL
jgi:hypothetical protein